MGAAMAATADSENESENESENGRLGIPPVLLFGLGFAGLVEMWDAASLCHFYQDNEAFSCGEFHLAFAVSAGVITVVLCLILAIMNQNLCGCLKRVAEMAHFVIGCTLALLWVAQVCVCTTQKPFAPASPTEMYNRHHPGNGYLASWASFIFSFRLLATTTYMQPRMAKLRHVIEEWRLHVKILATILFASVIESGQALYICTHEATECSGMLLWGLLAGGGSTLFCVLFLVGACVERVKPYLMCGPWGALLLVCWWLAGVFLLTMPGSLSRCDDQFCNGVFLSVSNGFLASWIALLGSFALAQNVKLTQLDFVGSFRAALQWCQDHTTATHDVHEGSAAQTASHEQSYPRPHPYPGLAPAGAS